MKQTVILGLLLIGCIGCFLLSSSYSSFFSDHPKYMDWVVDYYYLYTDDAGNPVYSIFTHGHPFNTSCQITFPSNEIAENGSTRCGLWYQGFLQNMSSKYCPYMTSCPSESLNILLDFLTIISGVGIIMLTFCFIISICSSDNGDREEDEEKPIYVAMRTVDSKQYIRSYNSPYIPPSFGQYV